MLDRSSRRRLLLATTSVATLMAAGSSAFACTITVSGPSGPVTNPLGSTIDCIQVTTAGPGVVTGNVTNAGTLTGGGLGTIEIDTNATVTGQIINTGSISAAIRGFFDSGLVQGGFNNSGHITSSGDGLFIDGTTAGAQTFTGGITNSGTVTASGGEGIFLSSTIFTGGINNSAGTISGGLNGINYTVDQIHPTTIGTISGGIANTGSITGSGGNAINLLGGKDAISNSEGTFAGGIANAGALTGSVNGIYVASFRSFQGDIVNSVGGTITANGGDGILVDHLTSGGNDRSITTFTGGVTNAGTITASGNGIRLDTIASFSGNVSNSGTITANGGDGINLNDVTLAGVVSNSGTITATGNGILINNGPGVDNGVGNSGTIHGGLNGLFVQDTRLLVGGISNGGIITGAHDGIFVTTNLTFSGGITNTGSISGGGVNGNGIELGSTITFQGGITNTGTVTGTDNGAGISIGSVHSFFGDINNSGTITGGIGIQVLVSNTFAGVINNTGNITGTTGTAIALGTSPNAVTVNQQAGTITGAINLSDHGDIVNVTGGTLAGDVNDAGAGHVGTVNFAPTSGSFTYANTISLVSAVNVNSGTLFLQGTLSPTVAVTIASLATLVVQNGGNITSNIVDNGILAVQRSTAFTYNGVISGTGVFEQNGPGTTTLTGTNLYSGGTQINGGTLSVSSDANLGNAAGGLSFNGGTLQFGFSFNTFRAITLNAGGGTFDTNGNIDSLSGQISGPGGLTKVGAGILLIDLASSYSGATNVNVGTLQAAVNNVFSPNSAFTVASGALLVLNGLNEAIGSLAGAGNVTLGAGTLTTGGDGTSTAYSGAISGTGGLTKVGAGNFNLTGTSLYTGATNVNGGILSVNGSIATSSLTTVNAGGTLGGNGIVGNTLINGGALAPGNSIGLITVAGNLAFTSAASYMVEVSPTNADRTNVTGTANLGGATVNALFGPGTYVAKQYTILNAAGGLGGTIFNPAVVSNLSGLNATLSYDPKDAFLNIVFTQNQNPNLNVNQQNISNALANAFAAGGLPAAFFTTPAGLTQLSGETATGTQQTTFDAMNLFLGLLTDPFVAGRGDGVSWASGAPQFVDENANAYAATSPARDAYGMFTKAPPLAPRFDQRWSVWAAGYGGSQTTDGNAVLGSNTATSSIYGTAVGADYRISPYTLAGFALAGGATSFSVANGGTGRSDLFQAGAFARTTVGPAYISAALAYGWQDITTDRTVTVAGSDHLRAEFNANAFSGRLEGGHRFVMPWMVGITPYAAAQVTTFQLPAYAEGVVSGANTFALAYGAKTVTDTRGELGLRSDKSWAMQTGIFTLRGRAAWAYDFNPDRSIGATFQTLPGASFVVNGAVQAHNAALTTASAEWKWVNGFSLAATFEGEFSDVTRSYAGKGVARYSW